MQTEAILKPFPHIIINDTYSEKELKEIFREIANLKGRLKGPVETGSATDANNLPKKRGLGLWLDGDSGEYTHFQDRALSPILTYNRKIFNDDIRRSIEKLDYFFKAYYFQTRKDCTLLQIYGDGDYYEKHTDGCVFSAITILYKLPKKYEGGELVFQVFDRKNKEYKVDLLNNQTIIFPSMITHEVLPVSKKDDKFISNRFTITTFINI